MSYSGFYFLLDSTLLNYIFLGNVHFVCIFKFIGMKFSIESSFEVTNLCGICSYIAFVIPNIVCVTFLFKNLISMSDVYLFY